MGRGLGFLLVSIPFLLGIGPYSCEWGPVSSHFDSLDIDSDRRLSLDEWMAHYGPHTHDWELCWGSHFEPADCDGDLHLTWPEYYRLRFRHEFCGENPGLLLVTRPVFDESSRRFVIEEPMKVCRPGPNAGPSGEAIGRFNFDRICP